MTAGFDFALRGWRGYSPKSFPACIFSQMGISPSIPFRAIQVGLDLIIPSPEEDTTASLGDFDEQAIRFGLAILRIKSKHFIASVSLVSPDAETVASHSLTHRCNDPSFGGSLRVCISNSRMRASVNR